VRPWITLLLIAGSLAAAVRHVMGHRHPILIPLLLVPALVLGWMEWQWRQDQATFSAVATEIAGRPVSIECQRFGGALLDVTAELGYVQFDASGRPSDTGRLERTACSNLRDYLHGDKSSPPLDQVIAVQVLAHESYHLAGSRIEAEAECRAMQRLEDVAGWLGASPSQARSLADRYSTDVYPRMPSAYQTADCVDGGPLDLAPDDPTWP
jgi:hypothetical protein